MSDAFAPAALDDFDDVSTDQIEATRQALGFSTDHFAESLGWSKRKYQRLLEAGGEDGAVARDIALAVYGLKRFLGSHQQQGGNTLELTGGDVPPVFSTIAGREDTWTVQIAPFLMQALVQRAKAGQTTTYGAEAERLEFAGKTKRVWPRTVYAHPLGLICEVCIEIGSVKNTPIPLLTAIVVAQSGEPGAGFDGMVQRYLRHHAAQNYKEAWKAFKADRMAGIRQVQSDVFAFPHWDEVLRLAGIPSR